MSRALVAALVALACLAVAPSAFARAADAVPQTSSNWAGYAIADETTISTGTTDETVTEPLQFSDVTATWKLPKVTCHAGTATYAAFWVGLGGFSSDASALEQTGVDADCSEPGKPLYYAWYELVPAPSVQVALRVAGGDTITAAVVVDGTDVLVQVKDRTRGTSFTKHLAMASPDLTSAEWIAEAPSECTSAGFCRVLPLANFGRVGFTNVAAIANEHPGTLLDPLWSAAAISLIPESRRGILGATDNLSNAGAAPAAPSGDGRSFTVGFRPNP